MADRRLGLAFDASVPPLGEAERLDVSVVERRALGAALLERGEDVPAPAGAREAVPGAGEAFAAAIVGDAHVAV